MENSIEELLNKNPNKLKEYVYPVNNGTPYFTKLNYKTIEGAPIYFEPDEFGRASGAMAVISKNTLSIKTEKYR